MKLNNIIFKNRFYIPLIYILIIIGWGLSCFFKVDSKKFSIFLIIFTNIITPFSCLYLTIIYDKLFKNKGESFKSKYIKIYEFVGHISLIINPILISYLFFQNSFFNFNDNNYILTF